MLKLYKELQLKDSNYIVSNQAKGFSKKNIQSRSHVLITDLIIIIFNSENCSPRNCIINIAPTVSYRAIPSRFIAAPIGIMNFVILEFMPRSPKHFIV